jgi:hypothetical protein
MIEKAPRLTAKDIDYLQKMFKLSLAAWMVKRLRLLTAKPTAEGVDPTMAIVTEVLTLTNSVESLRDYLVGCQFYLQASGRTEAVIPMNSVFYSAFLKIIQMPYDPEGVSDSEGRALLEVLQKAQPELEAKFLNAPDFDAAAVGAADFGAKPPTDFMN